MKAVIGLGNPGERYRATRHNIGVLVVEELRRRHGVSEGERCPGVTISRVRSGPSEWILARPLTYMNRSGRAATALLGRMGTEPRDLLVVCDDLYLDLGIIRLRRRGSAGGHNGLRSITEALGTNDFPRLRVGVGPADSDSEYADFVLAPFPASSRKRVPEIIDLAADCIDLAVTVGLQAAMNRYNRRQSKDEPGAGERL